MQNCRVDDPACGHLSWICVIILCVIPILLFPGVALGKEIWTVGDFARYNLPLHVAISHQWRSGIIPLWNPYITAGVPLAASLQGGVFYPLNVPLLLLPDIFGFGLSILAHVALTGVFMFFYLRSLDLSRWAALTGGLVFQLSGFVMSHLGHMAILRGVAWLPLILMAIQKWRDRRTWRWVCVGAGALACSFLAGYPQITVYSALTALAYLAFLFFQTNQNHWRFLLGGLALFVFGFGLSSVQLVLTVTTWDEYLRQMSFEYFTMLSFRPSYIIRLITPFFNSETVGYVGVPTLLLSAFALFVRHKQKNQMFLRFYLILSAVSLLLAMGQFTPLAAWTFKIPAYNRFSVVSRHLLEFDFSLVVLAALGVDALASKRFQWISLRQIKVLAGIGLAALVVLGLIWRLTWGVPDNGSPPLVWNEPITRGLLRGGALTLLTLGIIVGSRLVKRPYWAMPALLLLLFMDLRGTTGRGYVPHPYSWDQLTMSSDLANFLAQDSVPYRVMSFVSPESKWYSAEPRRAKWLLPNFNIYEWIESATGYDAVVLTQLIQMTQYSLPPHGLVEIPLLYNSSFVRYLDLSGTRYFIVPLEVNVPNDLIQHYPLVFQDAWSRVLLNEHALPRIFFVPEFESLTHPQAIDALQRGVWRQKSFDPSRLALAEYTDKMIPHFDEAAQIFGSQLFLMDYRVSLVSDGTTGLNWQLTTTWACQAPIPKDYTLYVHFVDESGQMVLQADHLLGEQSNLGYHSTGAWFCPALIQDIVSVPVQSLPDPDAIRIAVGVWRPETGERLSPDPTKLEVDEHGRVILGFVSHLSLTSDPVWQVANIERDENRIAADLDLDQSGLVVHASNYSAGWSVWVDGNPAPLVRVDGFLQGVFVPAGHHRLEFIYRPIGFSLGLAMSLMTLGLMFVTGFISHDVS